MSSTPPYLSVVVVTYNHADYIRQTLDSILAQEVDFPYEIIIGEDASSDGTREICQTYAARHPDKIRLLLQRREDNIKILGKPTGRFNLVECLRNCRGKYVAYCEGDDSWTDVNKLSLQVAEFHRDPDLALCFHRVHHQYPGGEPFADVNGGEERRSFTFSDQLQWGQGVTLSAMFRRDCLDPDEYLRIAMQSSTGDWPLFTLIMLHGTGVYLPRSMGLRNILPTGATAQRLTHEALLLSRRSVLAHLLDIVTDERKIMVQQLLQRVFVAEAVYKIRQAKLREGHEWLGRARQVGERIPRGATPLPWVGPWRFERKLYWPLVRPFLQFTGGN